MAAWNLSYVLTVLQRWERDNKKEENNEEAWCDITSHIIGETAEVYFLLCSTNTFPLVPDFIESVLKVKELFNQ
jgi:hypothetical protein